jgi:hypothetical protein
LLDVSPSSAVEDEIRVVLEVQRCEEGHPRAAVA